MIHDNFYIHGLSVCGELKIDGQICEDEYDTFVTELEAKARELWPHKFEAYKLPDPKFVKVEVVGNKPYELKHFDDGSTAWVEQVLELNDVIKLDKELRERQIPLNSKKP